MVSLAGILGTEEMEEIMKHPKQNYGVFHKKPTVVDGRVYKNAVFTSAERKHCALWAKSDPSFVVRKLNKQESEEYND